ncbi:MAG TPA: pyrroline-5-carboxylate reductase [Burkholderiales bacterium]|nr:pyrroline-5-carboxylate reductase [Burkholderiales bacterium]
MQVTFIGGGNMASAMIGGLIRRGWPVEAIGVVEIAEASRERLAREFGVRVFTAPEAAAAAAECIVLAVKPQQMRAAARALAPLLATQLVISIAAGIRLADLSRWLGGYRRLVRVMPNTPALALAGVSGLYAQAAVSEAERAAAETILGAVGTVLWFEREEELDAVTAVSGSGPAYVFYFIEALEQAACELGLAPQSARRLAFETFAGAVKLAAQSSEPPAALRERVTSKGGTTERALAVLEAGRVKEALVRAVRAAAERSRELGEELGKD